MQKAFLVLALAPLLMGGACEKKTAKADDPRPGPDTGGSVDTKPLPGVDLGKLDADKQQTFYRLVGTLSSPCGKSESLRVSFTNDTSCKRAPFAVRYLLALLEDDANAKQAEDEYKRKYAATAAPVKIDVSRAPHAGTEDAPIRLVEFYDYGCPHCQQFSPILHGLVDEEQGKIVLYYMMYPLEKHPDSKSAAAGALAAAQQGKFKEMHDVLFEKAPMHDREHVFEYAKQIGLDMGKFEQAYGAEAPHVAADQKLGESLGVDSTPTLFFNDRKYEGPMHKRYLKLWIDEELAVNR